MNRLSAAVRRLRGITAATTAAIIGSLAMAAPAAAASDHSVSIRGTAVCDAQARQWIITWTLTNHSDVPGTLGNVRAYPPDRALAGMPNRVQPGETITGTQRTLASEYTASVALDINWDDGAVSYNHYRPTYIFMYCAAA